MESTKRSKSLLLLLLWLVISSILVAAASSSESSNMTDNDIRYGYEIPVTILESAGSMGAVCLDGSPPAYHLVEGVGAGKDNWMVYLLGGAWCPTISDCLARKNLHLGSSTHWNDSGIPRFGGILHNVSAHNPHFYQWTKVMVRYCDGSSFTGDEETVDPTTGLYFRGKRVFDAVMGHLLYTKGMKDAKQVLLAGSSAGGLAVILHCDPFASLFPNTTKVKCLSDGGFFIHSNNPLQAQGLESIFRGTVGLHNSTGALPEACKNRMAAAYLCMFPQYVVTDIKTPLLVMATAYDAYQINVTLSTDFHKAIKDENISPTQYQVLQDFRLQFLDVMRQTDKLSRGVFINNCFTHTQLTFHWDNPNFAVNNKTDMKVIGEWFFKDRNHIQEIETNRFTVKYCKDM